jgi:hypothetical protein
MNPPELFPPPKGLNPVVFDLPNIFIRSLKDILTKLITELENMHTTEMKFPWGVLKAENGDHSIIHNNERVRKVWSMCVFFSMLLVLVHQNVRGGGGGIIIKKVTQQQIYSTWIIIFKIIIDLNV